MTPEELQQARHTRAEVIFYDVVRCYGFGPMNDPIFFLDEEQRADFLNEIRVRSEMRIASREERRAMHQIWLWMKCAGIEVKYYYACDAIWTFIKQEYGIAAHMPTP